MQNNKRKTKCDFCTYKTSSGCMVTPDSAYCAKAKEEYFAWLNNQKQPAIKTLRKWDRR